MIVVIVFNQTFIVSILLLAAFKAKYVQGALLGEGGFGSVFAGYRRRGKLPVRLTHAMYD